jgi:proline iminopeptidase
MKFWIAGTLGVALSIAVEAQAPAVKHPRGSYATVNGAKLWYETEGQGEPLILISGGPGDSHAVFHPFFSRLADRYQVIYFDPFGVGKSDRAKSAKEYTFAHHVEDLEGLRKTLGLAQVSLFGQSFGGMVAQGYAIKYPQSVKRLILADTFYSGEMWQGNDDSCNYEIRNQYPEVWDELQRVRARGLQSSAPEHQKLYYSVPLGLFYFHDASKAALLPKEEGNNDVYYAVAGDDADFKVGGDLAALNFRADLPKLKMPVLVIAGRFDRVSSPRYAVQFKRYLPQARFVMMEESGHFSFIEEPDKTVALLKDFLKSSQ